MGRRTRLLVTLLLGALLIAYVGAAVHSSSQRKATAREVAGTRLALTGNGSVPEQNGSPGAEVQAAQVALGLRNTGTVPLVLLATTLDGTSRLVDLDLPAGAQRDVPVAWQVRCAEVGTLRGPRVLHVMARGALRRHDIRLEVPESADVGLTQLFHRAAVRVCDVLVPR